DAARAEDGVVSPLRRRSEPAVPVEPGFGLFLGQVAGNARGADVDVYRTQLADAAAADQLARLAELVAGALLAAGLENALVAAHRLHHRARLVDRERERL